MWAMASRTLDPLLVSGPRPRVQLLDRRRERGLVEVHAGGEATLVVDLVHLGPRAFELLEALSSRFEVVRCVLLDPAGAAAVVQLRDRVVDPLDRRSVGLVPTNSSRESVSIPDSRAHDTTMTWSGAAAMRLRPRESTSSRSLTPKPRGRWSTMTMSGAKRLGLAERSRSAKARTRRRRWSMMSACGAP
jgi:hypothetical protein